MILLISDICLTQNVKFSATLMVFTVAILLSSAAVGMLTVAHANDGNTITAQLEQGVQLQDITCQNDDHILVMRYNGSPACVTEKSIDRLIQRGWELVILSELAPNNLGITMPITDRENFARLFADAAGDEVVEETSNGYKTVRGGMTIANGPPTISPFPSVSYKLDNYITTEPEQIKFMSNFMNKMKFENYDDTFSNKEYTKFDETVYTLEDRPSFIKFTFVTVKDQDYKYQLLIGFKGWINDPDSFVFELDKSTAQQIAHEFAATNEEINKSHKDGGECEYEDRESFAKKNESFIPNRELFIQDPPISESIFYDKPYYVIRIGFCTYDPTNTGHVYVPLILVDGITGEDVHLTYAGGMY